VPITITSKPERIAEYLKGVELKLSMEEVEEIMRVGLSHYFRASQVARFEADDRS
jgi:hypothetical protein